MALAAQKAAKPTIFVWEGSDRQGRRIKGQTRADNPNLVRAEMRKQGLRPIKIRKKTTALFSSRKQRITPKDIAVFSRQLATMMYAGVPLVQAFDIIGRGHEKPSMQDLVLSVKADVEGGTAPQAVRLQIERARALLAGWSTKSIIEKES